MGSGPCRVQHEVPVRLSRWIPLTAGRCIWKSGFPDEMKWSESMFPDPELALGMWSDARHGSVPPRLIGSRLGRHGGCCSDVKFELKVSGNFMHHRA